MKWLTILIGVGWSDRVREGYYSPFFSICQEGVFKFFQWDTDCDGLVIEKRGQV
jgi:hypothetical protein